MITFIFALGFFFKKSQSRIHFQNRRLSSGKFMSNFLNKLGVYPVTFFPFIFQ